MILPEGYYQAKQPLGSASSDPDEQWHEEPSEHEEEQRQDEPPPTYTRWADNLSSSSSSHPPRRAGTAPTAPAYANATNFQFISKTHGTINDKWMIDPTRHVPASLLPALRYGESASTRPNLRLETVSGSISANVILVPSSSANRNSRRDKTILFAKTTHGHIEFKLDEIPSENDTRRLPIELTLEACHGHINVWLPRTLRGFISSSTLSGTTTFSDAISTSGHLIENGSNTARFFVGDTSSPDLEYDEEGEEQRPEWQGDKVALKTMHGKVMIRYVGEDKATGHHHHHHHPRQRHHPHHPHTPHAPLFNPLDPGGFMNFRGGFPFNGGGFSFGAGGMPAGPAGVFPPRGRAQTWGFWNGWR